MALSFLALAIAAGAAFPI